MSLFSEGIGLAPFLGAAIISQCIFNIIYLSTYNWKQNRWLVLGFISILIPIFSLYFGESGHQVINTHLLDNPAFLLLFPPAFYFYTASMMNIHPQLNWQTILLFSPFIIMYPLIAIVGLVPPVDFFKVEDKLQIFVNASIIIVIFAAYFFFSWKILRLIALNQKKYINEFAESNVFTTLNWIKSMTYLFLGIIIIATIRFSLVPWLDSNILHIALPFSALLTIIYILSFFAFRQPILYAESSSVKNILEADSGKTTEKQEESIKAKQMLSEQERKELALRLEDYMKQQKPYLDPKIRMPMLASALNVSTNVFSYLINEHYRVNFFSFINERRIKYAAQLLMNGDYENYTLEAIGKMSGFNSRSTFNSRFKEFHGKTPREYRDSC